MKKYIGLLLAFNLVGCGGVDRGDPEEVAKAACRNLLDANVPGLMSLTAQQDNRYFSLSEEEKNEYDIGMGEAYAEEFGTIPKNVCAQVEYLPKANNYGDKGAKTYGFIKRENGSFCLKMRLVEEGEKWSVKHVGGSSCKIRNK